MPTAVVLAPGVADRVAPAGEDAGDAAQSGRGAPVWNVPGLVDTVLSGEFGDVPKA